MLLGRYKTWPPKLVLLGRRAVEIRTSVVQWHPFSPFFLVAAPLTMVFPKKGSLVFPGSLN